MGNAFCTTEKTNPLISVIVPVYRVEQYLTKCVDSIVSQTYRELEILLVDDGSPDECPEMCDAYALSDARVITIHKPNGGVSDARNAGLDIATGKGIIFVDSDDMVSTELIDRLGNAWNNGNNAQIVVSKQVLIKNENDIVNFEKIETDQVVQIDREQFRNYRNGMYVWGAIYSRDLIEITKLRFPKQLRYLEDEYWNYILVPLAHQILGLESELYYYRINPNSLSNVRQNQYWTYGGIKVKYLFFSKENLCFINSVDRKWINFVWRTLQNGIYSSFFYEDNSYQKFREIVKIANEETGQYFPQTFEMKFERWFPRIYYLIYKFLLSIKKK